MGRLGPRRSAGPRSSKDEKMGSEFRGERKRRSETGAPIRRWKGNWFGPPSERFPGPRRKAAKKGREERPRRRPAKKGREGGPRRIGREERALIRLAAQKPPFVPVPVSPSTGGRSISREVCAPLGIARIMTSERRGAPRGSP
jgi:hypothetical protein